MRQSKELLIIFVASAAIIFGFAQFLAKKKMAPIELDHKQESLLLPYISKKRFTIIKFMDYQCPPCRGSENYLEKIAAKNNLERKLFHFPLSFHKYAPLCAYAAEVAKKSNKFMEVHKALMKSEDLSEIAILRILKENRIYIDDKSWKNNKNLKSIIDSNKKLGNDIGIKGTPALFLYTPENKIFRIDKLDQLDTMVR